ARVSSRVTTAHAITAPLLLGRWTKTLATSLTRSAACGMGGLLVVWQAPPLGWTTPGMGRDRRASVWPCRRRRTPESRENAPCRVPGRDRPAVAPDVREDRTPGGERSSASGAARRRAVRG